VSDERDLAPVTDGDFETVRAYVAAQRAGWESDLTSALGELTAHLVQAGYLVLEGAQRSAVMTGRGTLAGGEVVASGRVKQTDAIVAKMRRFGEPLRVILDVFGFRVVVASDDDLDAVAGRCAELWATPTPTELLLRHGALQFGWWRDYRKRNHAGLSGATTAGYDEAIHLNRRAPFGIAEIQVLTIGLFRRVYCDPVGEDSHDRYVARRESLFRDAGGE
jgi:hypothetical protein